MRARWNREAHHLLDCFDPDETIRNGGDVIEAIPVRRDLRVHAVLGDLLHTAMEVTDIAIEIHNGFAIELENHAQHTVRRRMLRPHVQHHLRAVEQCLLSCRYLYLMHFELNPVFYPRLSAFQAFAKPQTLPRNLAYNIPSHGTARSPTQSPPPRPLPSSPRASTRSHSPRSPCSTRSAAPRSQPKQTPRPRPHPACQTLSLRIGWRSLSASFIFRHHFLAANKYLAHQSFLRH